MSLINHTWLRITSGLMWSHKKRSIVAKDCARLPVLLHHLPDQDLAVWTWSKRSWKYAHKKTQGKEAERTREKHVEIIDCNKACLYQPHEFRALMTPKHAEACRWAAGSGDREAHANLMTSPSSMASLNCCASSMQFTVETCAYRVEQHHSILCIDHEYVQYAGRWRFSNWTDHP